MKQLQLELPDTQATERLGAALAAAMPPQAAIYLYGELGAGKTTLVRALLRALGHQGAVRSPTYTLVEPYEIGTRRLYHLDLYRLGDPEELEYLGLRELMAEGVCLIEWPQRGEGWLPTPDLSVSLNYRGTGRTVVLSAGSALGERLLSALKDDLDHPNSQ